MRSIFKQIIKELHQESLVMPIQRAITLPNLPDNVHKAFIFMGMRRTGKTWVLYQHMRNLLAEGVTWQQILYINFEDERLFGAKASDLQFILEGYFELYPELAKGRPLYFFFDEIQNIEGWEKFIRRILDKENLQIFISGSSAKMLSKEIDTSLRGRTISREIFPFSFKEYLYSKEIIPQLEHVSTKQKSELIHWVNVYMKKGGFPETLNAGDALHRELLQGYINVVILKDIIERYAISNVSAIKFLMNSCLRSPATKLSINKCHNVMKSLGMTVGKNALYDCMQHIEDAYCILTVPAYAFSFNESSQKPKKIYPIDPGLITAFTVKSEFDYAAQLETTVFLHLRRSYKDIYYYETKGGKEIDFLISTPEGNISLYQVCLNLGSAETLNREVTALEQAMKDLSVKEGVIVTLDEEKEILSDAGTITCYPLWKFLCTELKI